MVICPGDMLEQVWIATMMSWMKVWNGHWICIVWLWFIMLMWWTWCCGGSGPQEDPTIVFIHISIYPYIQISRYPDIQISTFFTYVLLSGMRLEFNRTPPSHCFSSSQSDIVSIPHEFHESQACIRSVSLCQGGDILSSPDLTLTHLNSPELTELPRSQSQK